MLSAVGLVCDYQGKVDVGWSKMGRISIQLSLHIHQCGMITNHKIQDHERFYLVPQLLNLNEKY